MLLALLCLAWQSGCEACPSWWPACESRSTYEFSNIVFITIDTLRADRLGMYGYFRDTSPILDALASESILFERCFAPMATTYPSHLSLFTGTYPNETGAIANVGDRGKAFQPTNRLRTLAQLLRDEGYRTAAFVSAAPLKRYSGLDAGFDVFTQPEGHSRRAQDTNADVFDWLDTTDEQHFFLWVHYFDPHWPYAPLPPFSDKFHSGPELTAYLEERSFAPADDKAMATEIANNYYDAEISYVDEQIGKLLDALRSRGNDWENTIIVVLSDHGEGLGQHGELQHGSVWNEQLHVVLFMRIPGHAPARIDRLMSVADVVPTLMGLTGLPVEDAFRRQASGLDRLSNQPGTTFILSQESSAPRRVSRRDPGPRYTLTGDEWKYVFKEGGETSLFQLSTDPHELVDVIEDQPEVAARLRTILLTRLEEQEKRLAIHQAAGTAIDAEIDPAIIKQMRALGYIQ